MLKKNLKSKVNKALIIIILFLIIIIVLLSLFGFKAICNFILGLDYIMITALVSLIAVIYTIINDRREKNKSIEATVRAQNQIEFEQRLYDVLNIYDKLIYDISSLRFEYNNTNNGENNLIVSESIAHQIDCIAKYRFLLYDMEYKIKYFYKYYDCNHTEFDKFIKDIQGLNQSIALKLEQYGDLSLKAHNVNSDYNNYQMKMRTDKKESPIYDFTLLKSIVEDSNKIVKDIGYLISNKKPTMYEEAIKCIRERERIIKENEI